MTVENVADGSRPDTIELPQRDKGKTKKVTRLLGKPKMNLYKIFKKSKGSSTTPDSACIATDKISDATAADLTFEENLEQQRFSKASEQLIVLEKNLFGQKAEAKAEELEKLERDYEVLFNHIWLAVEGSLRAGSEQVESLQQAVSAIQLEEEQDRWWMEESPVEEEVIPLWRPRKPRATHDTLLSQVVKKRLEDVDDVPGAHGLSSVKNHIFKVGKRLQEDLLRVTQDLKECYPKEFDICNVYAQLYHEAFKAELASLMEFQVDIEDTVYILSWVHDHYPKDVLQNEKLKLHVDTEALGCLLPEHIVDPMKDAYLSYKESKMKGWASNALRKEEQWLMGNLPKKQDGWYVTNIAIDLIELFALAAEEVRSVLGDMEKAKRIMGQLEDFLKSYKTFLQDVMKGKYGTPAPVLKAHLVSLGQFKDYIVKNSKLLPAEVRDSCLALLVELIKASHMHLTASAHKELKPRYSKLGTGDWLAGTNPGVLGELEKHIEVLKMDLNPGCHEELLGHMHIEVMVEYVKRLMKRKLKLTDKAQQERAAALLCEDSNRFHELFTEAGSKEEWLKNVPCRIAEVLRTHDLSFIQLEVAILARDFPDLTSRHIAALLSIKHNLSSDDISKIKKSVKENRSSIESPEECRDFFSMVTVKHRYI